MHIEPFGECDLGPVQVVTIGTAPGPVLEVLDLGATTHRLWVTCGDGVRRNVVLGHARAQDHLDFAFYIGGTIGRYANRIAQGRFTLDGQPVQLGVHDRGNHLHGGPDGFDRRLWEVVDGDDDHVRLRLLSPDGDQGFPGNLTTEVRYWTLEDRVRVEYTATTDAPTLVNLTSHAYFNLNGEASGTADDHFVQVGADHYLPVDGTGLPLDGLAPVDDTPFDLRLPAQVADLVRSDHPQITAARGIDHNYAPNGRRLAPAGTAGCAPHPDPAGAVRRAARAAGVHRQLPRRIGPRDLGGALPAGRRARPGAAALPGQSQPRRLRLAGPASGRELPRRAGVALHHHRWKRCTGP